MPDAQHVVLYIMTAAMVYMALAAGSKAFSLRKAVRIAARAAPVDAESGLLAAEAIGPRLDAEIRRARRFDGSLSIVLLHAPRDPPYLLGRAMLDELEFPEVAFRLGGAAYCVAVANREAPELGALIDRLQLCAGGPLVTGTARFPEDHDELDGLMACAAARLATAAGAEAA